MKTLASSSIECDSDRNGTMENAIITEIESATNPSSKDSAKYQVCR